MKLWIILEQWRNFSQVISDLEYNWFELFELPNYTMNGQTWTVQILTQEEWNEVLYNGMAKTSHWSALYFIALMTFGNYVLFNLLVAILVEGFSTDGEVFAQYLLLLKLIFLVCTVSHNMDQCYLLLKVLI